MDLSKASFWGYRRENGRVGVRNHVVILPVDDLSNAAAQAVENSIKGTLALPHPYGRLQFGADLELHFRTLIGAGSNPNVAAAIVIGIEEGWTARVVEGIKQTGKPVSGFGIEGHGDHETIRRASQKAKELLQWASELRREQRPLKDLWVSTKCGESDTTSGCGANPTVGNAFDKLYPHGVTLVFGETTELTGGEQLVAARCRNDAVRKKFQFVFDRYQEVIDRHKTGDLMDSQPTKGNIAGGLTTIEEKALGNIQKIGRKCLVDGVLDKAETPTGPGLWFMDSSSAAAEMVTLCAAAGYVVHFFPTGQGNVIGNPILPVIKLCANPRTVRTMSEHIDVDVSGLLRKELTPDQAGDRLLDCMFRTAVEVWRGGAQGAFQSFEVPRHPSQTVLDVVTYIQRSLDATLAYRFACRVGMCGSCAMSVNGVPRWTCRTHVDKVARENKLVIAPLRNLPVIRDLVTDMRGFFDKWARAKGSFAGTKTRRDDFARVAPDSADRRKVDAGIECIGCGVCYSACDVVAWNPEYLGPAALNRAWTLVKDERDVVKHERLRAVAGDAGCHACHTHMSCTERCPMGLSPTAAISGLKRAVLGSVLKGEL